MVWHRWKRSVESTPRGWIPRPDTGGLLPFGGFVCPEESGRMALNFVVIRPCFSVFLTKKGSLFKLSLVGKGKDLVLMARKSFHTISNILRIWPGVFLFQEAIVDFQENHLLLVVTYQSSTGKNCGAVPTKPHSSALLGVLSTECQAPMVPRRLREVKGSCWAHRWAPRHVLRCPLFAGLLKAGESLPAFSPHWSRSAICW